MTTASKLEIRRSVIITLKFALATITALWLGSLFAPNDVLSCGFVALVTLEPTLFRGLRASLEQLIATLVAAAITVLVFFFTRGDPSSGLLVIETGVSAGLVALFCVRYLKPGGQIIALFTVLYMCIMPWLQGESFWETLHLRTLTILVGIATSTLFNLLFSLFRHRDRLHLRVLSRSAELRGLLIDLEEAFAGLEAPPHRRVLSRHLRQLQVLFADIREVMRDIEEVQRESRQLTRLRLGDVEQQTNHLRQVLVRRMNNIGHYVWNMVLTLGNYQVESEHFVPLRRTLSDASLAFRKAHRSLVEMETSHVAPPDATELAEQVTDALAPGRSGGAESAALLSLASDRVLLQINVVEYATAVCRYVSLSRGGTCERSESGPPEAVEPSA